LNYVNPLAGGGTVASNPANLWSPNAYTTGGQRWTSARVVRCGLRIIPTANITVKQGVLTAGVLPGKGLPMTNLDNSSTGNVIFNIPTPEALRQLPTSYEVALANLD